MVFAFAAGEFSYMDSGVFPQWSDRDDYPVSARNYADEVFRYDPDVEETSENIIDELNDYFGEGQWHIHADKPNVAVADDTTSAWPFVVRRQVILVKKYHNGVNGWVEKPFPIPVKYENMMETHIEVKVWIDCD
jgi:hypothetical protein